MPYYVTNAIPIVYNQLMTLGNLLNVMLQEKQEICTLLPASKRRKLASIISK